MINFSLPNIEFKAVLKNPYLMAFVKVFLVLYASQIAPTLPTNVLWLFDNSIVKIVFLTLMVYIAENDLQLALIMAVVFVMTTKLLSGKMLFENFANFSKNVTNKNGFKLIEPKTAVFPGCLNIKMDDLLRAFDNDQMKLQNTVSYSFRELLASSKSKDNKEMLMKFAYATGLPYNVEFNDENAPLIATILMYAGFVFGDSCRAPH